MFIELNRSLAKGLHSKLQLSYQLIDFNPIDPVRDHLLRCCFKLPVKDQ